MTTQSTKDLAHYLERYRTFSQGWKSHYLQKLQSDFEIFTPSLDILKKEAEQNNQFIRYAEWLALQRVFDAKGCETAVT